MKRFFGFLFGFAVGLAPALAAQDQITVFAAASLRGALEEIAAVQTNDVRFSFAGSGTIARQIAAGAPADAIVLANLAWMEWLSDQGGVDEADVTTVVGNNLVLIGQADAAPLNDLSALKERLGTARLAMGQRDAVPAGIYARQWLTRAGQWDAVKDRLAETDNVRAALALVARGDVPLGVVYATDAQAEPAVKILWHIPPTDHDPIRYPAAALTAKGKSILTLLHATTAQDIFAKHGFTAVQE